MTSTNRKIPEFPASFWRETEIPSFQKLEEDITVDVAIVGGGITGITTGYLLAKEGVKTAIIEAGKILTGTTGHTTAKITAQHGLIYDELIQHFGEEKAKLYYDASIDSLNFIKTTVEQNQIDCDFREQDAVIYSVSDEYAEKLQKEWKAYEKLNIAGKMIDSIPFNIDIKNGIAMPGQAQFHPLKYLRELVRLFVNAGGMVYENTTAEDIEDGDHPTVLLRNGKRIKCQYLIAASHFPFCDKKGLYFARMYVERAYVLGIKTDKEYPGGMYISADTPTRSLRSTPINGEELILVSGEGHKTGQGINTMKHYEALEKFAEDVFGIKEYKYRWSAQDIYTLDKIPYVGPITENQPNVLIATGYRKWGMTNGTSASHLLKDIVLNKENRYKDLFSPSRFNADPDIKTFVSANLDVAKHLIKGKMQLLYGNPDELQNGQAAIVTINGERAGAYKDENGTLHIVDTTCRHLGCEVEWNEGEKTWDCPCHGSRYSIDGEVINGPATKPLKKIEQWKE